MPPRTENVEQQRSLKHTQGLFSKTKKKTYSGSQALFENSEQAKWMLLRFISKDESNQLRNHTIRAKVFHKVQGSHMVFYKFKSHMLGCSYGLSRK